jgi:hypothetical protein
MISSRLRSGTLIDALRVGVLRNKKLSYPPPGVPFWSFS